MTFRKGQKVICINNDCAKEELTVGNLYDVLEVRVGGIIVLNDAFHEDAFCFERFEAYEYTPFKQRGHMTKEDYIAFHEATCAKMVEITKRKNHDYTGTNQDPFANFKSVENNGICTAEQGFLVRMSDKMARITSFVQKGVLQVQDESVEDTLLDLANYSILLAGYIKSIKQGGK